jgi:hypothetical protein
MLRKLNALRCRYGTTFAEGHFRSRFAEYREAALSVCISVSPSAGEGIKDRECSESFIFLLRNADWSAELLLSWPILLGTNVRASQRHVRSCLQKLRNPDKFKFRLESALARRNVPQGLKPGFLFSGPDRHEWNSCPSRAFAGWVCLGLTQSQQQVPHRAFGPVRNDKGLFWWLYAALKRGSFTAVLAAAGIPLLQQQSQQQNQSQQQRTGASALHGQDQRSRATDRSVRPIRFVAGGWLPLSFTRRRPGAEAQVSLFSEQK